LEDIGCTRATYITPISIIFVILPPLLIGLVSARYAVPTIIAFNRRRVELNDHLVQPGNLSSSLHLRLMCFGGLEILCTIPLASFFLYAAIDGGVSPWIDWRNVHSNFSRVVFLPRSVWSKDSSLEPDRWIAVIGAFNFVAFFGFAEEARTNYRAVYLTVSKHIGLSTASTKPSGSPLPRSKRNDIEALVFAHPTTTNVSTLIPDGKNHNANKIEHQTPQVNTTSDTNTFFNAAVNDCHLYPIPPEPAVTES
jgi:pheromone a factor receptor